MNVQNHMAEDGTKQRRPSQIDENLRRVYEEALSEEVPDKFRQLLEQLRKAQAERGK